MKLIEVVTSPENIEKVPLIASELDITFFWTAGKSSVRLLAEEDKTQKLLDSLYGLLGPEGRIIIINPEAVLPRPDPDKNDAREKAEKTAVMATREELYEDVEKSAHADKNFLILVSLSTIVAAIGLIENNIAVVIGAMVIAPLLGPNIALALSTALGDTDLMWKSLRSNFAGIGIAIFISILIGWFWPSRLEGDELMARTTVGLEGIALALASGAAASLSLTSGLSSILVGVMVAVALLPPAVAMGLMLGSGNINLAFGAGLLLAVNIVCINLSAKIIFLVKGIKPRTWLTTEKARQSTFLYLAIWIISLIFLVSFILTH